MADIVPGFVSRKDHPGIDAHILNGETLSLLAVTGAPAMARHRNLSSGVELAFAHKPYQPVGSWQAGSTQWGQFPRV